MFRAMKAETDGLPKVGRSGRELGVRIDGPTRDLAVAQDGTVEPGTGGMSVALDAAQNLPKPRLPRSLGGEGRDHDGNGKGPSDFAPSPGPLSACPRRAEPPMPFP